VARLLAEALRVCIELVALSGLFIHLTPRSRAGLWVSAWDASVWRAFLSAWRASHALRLATRCEMRVRGCGDRLDPGFMAAGGRPL